MNDVKTRFDLRATRVTRLGSFNEPLRTELGPNGLELENKTKRGDRADVAALRVGPLLK